MGLFDKIKYHFTGLFTGKKLDDDFFDELEEALIGADIGVTLSTEVVAELRDRVIKEGLRESDQAKELLQQLLIERMSESSGKLDLSTTPSVVIVIGVNGVGKTTTLGKLANHLHKQGKRVLLAAGDTFRAAAADQLEIWSKRANCEIIRQHEGADSAAVVFDALNAARARKVDAVLIDTAGRLHNKTNLMHELATIGRVIDRELPGAARECLLVLDATTGQNGLMQAAQFTQSIPLTGLVLTKMDGTAKGGVAVAVSQTLGVPVKLVGVGEQVDDLIDFNPAAFIKEIIG